MTLKADWYEYLHDFRVREFRLIFDRFDAGTFDAILELGAGDGFQSRLLASYGERVVATDVRLPPVEETRVEARVLSAEQAAEAFSAQTFDLVYSSNMLEHVPDVQAALNAIRKVLTDDGITIHVMPNRYWKACHLALWIPHLCAGMLDDLVAGKGPRALLERARSSGDRGGDDQNDGGSEKNNPTVIRRRRSLLSRALVPDPHGVSTGHLEEFKAFGRRRWEKEFSGAGFELIAVLDGPFSSGYGFGARAVTSRLEHRVGSEYVFVAKKKGHRSRYEHYLC